MLKPDEIIPVSVGELYRYRLAVQDQLLRVEAATQAMRARRDQIERDEEELLIGPSTSMVREQLEEIRRSEAPEWWRRRLSSSPSPFTASSAWRSQSGPHRSAI